MQEVKTPEIVRLEVSTAENLVMTLLKNGCNALIAREHSYILAKVTLFAY